MVIVLALAFGTPAALGAGPSADVAAMHAADQTWVKAFNSNDPATAANLYDENAILMPPGTPAVRGRAAIKAALEKNMADAAKDGISFSLDPKPDSGVSGDLGWVSGIYTVKDKSGKVLETGKYLSVSHKKGGKWLYIRDTWNADAAPAAEPAPPAKK